MRVDKSKLSQNYFSDNLFGSTIILSPRGIPVLFNGTGKEFKMAIKGTDINSGEFNPLSRIAEIVHNTLN